MNTDTPPYIETVKIHTAPIPDEDIPDFPTLILPAWNQDATQTVPVTPAPSMPDEVAAGPGWQLFQYGVQYALVLYSIEGKMEFAIPALLGVDIHLRYKRMGNHE